MQHDNVANETGIYVIHNKPTGGVFSELAYAGMDKLRELTGWTRLLIFRKPKSYLNISALRLSEE